jgi:hypothetical protein
MADRTDELRSTAAQCLALAQSTTDPQTRAALLIMAQKLNDMASHRPRSFEMTSGSSMNSKCFHRSRHSHSRRCSNNSKSSRRKKKNRRV